MDPPRRCFQPPCFVDEVLVRRQERHPRAPRGPWRSRPKRCRTEPPRDDGASPVTTVALNRRAPSRCVDRPLALATSITAAMSSRPPDGPAGQVGRLFHPHEPGLGRVPGQRRQRRGQLLAACKRLACHRWRGPGPGEDSRATGFGVQRVGSPVAVELVARPTVQRQRDLVAHRPRGQEHGGRFAEEFRHRFDQLIYARVFAELLVPDRRVDISPGAWPRWARVTVSLRRSTRTGHCAGLRTEL